jgi:CheY-like chemotaxis protein
VSGPEDDEDDALSLLLVEDDEVDRLAFRRALSTAGLVAQVVEAPSLAAARDALVGGDFDCAVVDLGLPDGSGMELLGARRGDGRALPMVVLTGAGGDPQRRGRLRGEGGSGARRAGAQHPVRHRARTVAAP